MDIIFATKNKGKVNEIVAMLEGTKFNVTTMEEAGIEVDVVEDGDTFEANATKKAVEIMKLTGKIALADDSGLEVDALGGKPGIHSARFLGESTPYSEKNGKILEMLDGVENRGARFVSVVAAAFPDGRIILTKGVLEGEIAKKSAGNGGFGYDPIFYLPEYDMTVAEMSMAQKNEISHRGQAFAKMKEKLVGL